MIFVLVYVFISASFFVWVLNGSRFKRLDSKVINNHPEMKEVKRSEPLLVIRFDNDSTPGSRRNEQSSDLGFSKFLADNGSNSGDHDCE